MIIDQLFELSRARKRLILMALDIVLAIVALWIALVLRLEELVPLTGRPIFAVPVAVGLVVVAFSRSGVYDMVFRYAGRTAACLLIRSWAVYATLFFIVVSIVTLPEVPRSIGVIQPMLFLILTSGSRFLIRGYIAFLNERLDGSGIRTASLVGFAADLEKLAALTVDIPNVKINGIYSVDTPPADTVCGFIVRPLDDMEGEDHVSNKHDICIPDSDWGKPVFNELLRMFDRLPSSTVRHIAEITPSGHRGTSMSNSSDLDLNALLGRTEAMIDPGLIGEFVFNKTIVVSGAAGTIGAELVGRCLKLGASRVVGLDISEQGLYRLREIYTIEDPRLTLRLCDCKDFDEVKLACSGLSIDLMIHAAAYKHVNIVEANPHIGLRNNILSTTTMLAAAGYFGVSSFVLISSDKAVRPTNLMGASKRLSELICAQYYSRPREVLSSLGMDSAGMSFPRKISVVRFGNVIGSSGSVLLKFRSQALQGLPVTVTHPEVNRFFMTVREAVGLVIAAGAITREGYNLYHLDMGEPVKISDLAKRVIFALGGRSDPGRLIEYTGLKPGEKLYEELLLSGEVTETQIPKVLLASEPTVRISFAEMANQLRLDADLEGVKDWLSNVADLQRQDGQ